MVIARIDVQRHTPASRNKGMMTNERDSLLNGRGAGHCTLTRPSIGAIPQFRQPYPRSLCFGCNSTLMSCASRSVQAMHITHMHDVSPSRNAPCSALCMLLQCDAMRLCSGCCTFQLSGVFRQLKATLCPSFFLIINRREANPCGSRSNGGPPNPIGHKDGAHPLCPHARRRRGS